MKYMGSKRSMLRNGLGEVLESSVHNSNRVVDLFTGSASVAWYAAESLKKAVLASDLQLFATYLAASIITRTSTIDVSRHLSSWEGTALSRLAANPYWLEASRLQSRISTLSASEAALSARSLTGDQLENFVHAYGGYYFSPWQAMWLDSLRHTVPSDPEFEVVAKGALIIAASRCAASPGHTAQPFKANDSAGPYLLEAWQRNPLEIVKNAAINLGSRHASTMGEVHCGDANNIVKLIREDDVVFMDPPYSGVHYSRFYHVLESLARGHIGLVSGNGRYPPKQERPISDYSLKTRSETALKKLFQEIANRGANAIITFPSGKASNGLSGDRVRELACSYFNIKQETIATKFSTLGGNAKMRAARQDVHELIISLTPK